MFRIIRNGIVLVLIATMELAMALTSKIVFNTLLADADHLRCLQAWWIGAEYLDSRDVLYQDKPNNCGPTAIKMVYEKLGINAPLPQIEQMTELDEDGTSLKALKECAVSMGLAAETWILTYEDLEEVALPAIALIRRSHFVVIERMESNRTLVVVDPAIGRLRFARRAFEKIWNGEILLIESCRENIQ